CCTVPRGDGGGEIVPHHTMYPPVAGVASLTEDSGQAEYPRQDPEPLVKEITNTKGPVPIRFEVRDKQALMPHGEHAAHWSSYIVEVIRGVSLYHPSWLKVPKERKAMLIADIGSTQFDLRPHIESPDWTEIHAASNSTCKKRTIPTRLLSRPIISFEMIPGTLPEPLKIGKTGQIARSYLDRDPGGDEEMRRLEATGTYTDDEINRLARGAGVACAGTTRRVPTIRTTRMRMAMAIVSCVIYGAYTFFTSIGIIGEKLQFRKHMPKEMAHYDLECWDAENLTSVGWQEVVGISDRGQVALEIGEEQKKCVILDKAMISIKEKYL
nr:glycine--tRNA ligase, mitochondrial 1-like [Tanacetum cinerariifolium]